MTRTQLLTEIRCIPPYQCEFNAIELIKAKMRNNIIRNILEAIVNDVLV